MGDTLKNDQYHFGSFITAASHKVMEEMGCSLWVNKEMKRARLMKDEGAVFQDLL